MADRKHHNQNDSGVILEERQEQKTKRPRMYKVLIFNDDYTPMEFVVAVLMGVFRHNESSATRIMLHVHMNGVGVAGVYTREIAETKVEQVRRLARQNEHPLMVSMEPESDGDE